MARKDRNALCKMNSASNHSDKERVENDFYATPTRMVDLLYKKEPSLFEGNMWEPCNGLGHISDYFDVVYFRSIKSFKSDIINRKDDDTVIFDFFDIKNLDKDTKTSLPLTYNNENNIWEIDANIVTNPPYNLSNEFYETACSHLKEGKSMALFLKIQFLETQKRYELFQKYPPYKVLICVNRVHCGADGKFNNKIASGGAACYMWLIYKAGYKGLPTIDWINTKEDIENTIEKAPVLY